jgi:GNAT-family acetyltransferase (TIGR03103 family)
VSQESSPAGAPAGYDALNQYSRIIVDEALRRNISVEVVDAGMGELVLTADGRRVTTIESLSELTSAVAFRRCDDKLYTRRVLQDAGLRIPAGRAATFDEADAAFLEEWRDIVVKPARGEGGDGVTVGVVDGDGLDTALACAKATCPDVLLEQRCDGEDLRVIVIGGEVVAASVRRPPTVTGDARRAVGELIAELSRSRAAQTDGAASIPLNEATREVVQSDEYDFDSVLPEGEVLAVRGTANVHTGGTIEDVTEVLHPGLAAVAVEAAEAIGIPVVGLDFIVPAVDGPEYLIIEANEQPGLANHEPQPTAERFLDLLFPESASRT